MNAKHCKNTRCSAYNKGPCAAWESCGFFMWDVEKEAGTRPAKKEQTQLESDEQITLYRWCRDNGIEMVHIPNERECSKYTGYLLAEQGVQKGFPDNFFPYARHGYHGLFIELKRAKKSLSKVSAEQKQWAAALSANGYKALICYGAAEAIIEIKKYMSE